MKIFPHIYEQLLASVRPCPPESGGILGGQDGIVTCFFLDRGLDNFNRDSIYSPDIGLLNHTIAFWQEKGIEFYGLFHTHARHEGRLSPQDIRYIRTIVKALPEKTEPLYFPVVFPGEKMIGYCARRYDGDVVVADDKIVFVE